MSLTVFIRSIWDIMNAVRTRQSSGAVGVRSIVESTNSVTLIYTTIEASYHMDPPSLSRRCFNITENSRNTHPTYKIRKAEFH